MVRARNVSNKYFYSVSIDAATKHRLEKLKTKTGKSLKQLIAEAVKKIEAGE